MLNNNNINILDFIYVWVWDSPPISNSHEPPLTVRLVSQARNVVLNVFKYFEKDKNEPVDEVLKKTSEATKVSQAVIYKIRLHVVYFENIILDG